MAYFYRLINKSTCLRRECLVRQVLQLHKYLNFLVLIPSVFGVLNYRQCMFLMRLNVMK